MLNSGFLRFSHAEFGWPLTDVRADRNLESESKPSLFAGELQHTDIVFSVGRAYNKTQSKYMAPN